MIMATFQCGKSWLSLVSVSSFGVLDRNDDEEPAPRNPVVEIVDFGGFGWVG
jgi:hypothetical protein